jgi:cytochrome c556
MEGNMRVLILAVGALSLVACVKQRNLTTEEIPKLTKLDDVMDVQSTVADPQFKKIGQASYSDADWAAFADTSARIQSTALKIKDFSKGAGFDALAVELNEKAKALGDAATAKDAAGASKALAEMKATCKSCHKQFK